MVSSDLKEFGTATAKNRVTGKLYMVHMFRGESHGENDNQEDEEMIGQMIDVQGVVHDEQDEIINLDLVGNDDSSCTANKDLCSSWYFTKRLQLLEKTDLSRGK